MAETTTTIDPNLLTLLQNSGQLSPLFGGNGDSIEQQQHSTYFPNLEQMTVTPPTFTNIDRSRNANDIFKFNTSIDDGGTAADMDPTSDAPYVIPLKIILPVEHVHKSKTNNSYIRYNYILLKVDDIAYHEHIPSDNTEILFPLVDNEQTENPTEMVTSVADIDNGHEATTSTIAPIVTVTDKATATTSTANVFDIDANEHTENANASQNDIVLVDSQGYRYELSHHIKIMDEFETNVVEFDSIAMVREKDDSSKAHTNHATKRILNDDDEQQQIDHEKNDINISKYERHYAKIFQWLHYHL